MTISGISTGFQLNAYYKNKYKIKKKITGNEGEPVIFFNIGEISINNIAKNLLFVNPYIYIFLLKYGFSINYVHPVEEIVDFI